MYDFQNEVLALQELPVEIEEFAAGSAIISTIGVGKKRG